MLCFISFNSQRIKIRQNLAPARVKTAALLSTQPDGGLGPEMGGGAWQRLRPSLCETAVVTVLRYEFPTETTAAWALNARGRWRPELPSSPEPPPEPTLLFVAGDVGDDIEVHAITATNIIHQKLESFIAGTINLIQNIVCSDKYRFAKPMAPA